MWCFVLFVVIYLKVWSEYDTAVVEQVSIWGVFFSPVSTPGRRGTTFSYRGKLRQNNFCVESNLWKKIIVFSKFQM